MKFLSLACMVLALLAVTIPASAVPEISFVGENKPGTIVLTAKDVTSAVDIENAVSDATRKGTRAGVVILDGKGGVFNYSGDDRSINIFYPNITVRGINNALIENCADGFFFDDVPANNVRIEGLSMRCEASFVVGGKNKRNVTIQKNIVSTSAVSIVVTAGENWQIMDNSINSLGNGVNLIQGKNITVSNNRIKGQIGLTLQSTAKSLITSNIIFAGDNGITVESEADKNQIKNNTILGVTLSGINFLDTVTNNTVSGNTVLCAWEQACLAVSASKDTAAKNKITGNRP